MFLKTKSRKLLVLDNPQIMVIIHGLWDYTALWVGLWVDYTALWVGLWVDDSALWVGLWYNLRIIV